RSDQHESHFWNTRYEPPIAEYAGYRSQVARTHAYPWRKQHLRRTVRPFLPRQYAGGLHGHQNRQLKNPDNFPAGTVQTADPYVPDANKNQTDRRLHRNRHGHLASIL